MSKLLSGMVIAAALMGLATTTQAQVPSASPTPTPPAIESQPAVTAPDLALLSKAVGGFWQTDRAETKSLMTTDI